MTFDEPPQGLEAVLERGDARTTHYRWWWLSGALLSIAGLLIWYFLNSDAEEKHRYQTEVVARHTLVVTISATGNLQPTNKVDVSSELSGIVTQVFVDENDQITKGQPLAGLDLSRLRDNVARSRASLAAARAQVRHARATTHEAHVLLTRLRDVFSFTHGLDPSQNDLSIAEANVGRAEANEAVTKANVSQAIATLALDRTNLQKAHIRSPISGVVLTRNVESGQTVAATLQAPVLFTLAEDLTKMELRVAVDEADVAQVRVGQRATFTVDAWPGRQYEGMITRVGYGSEVTDGVVSYPAVITVKNEDLSLRPGMTANASIIVATRENALLVPNAALRFEPRERVGDASSSPSSRGLIARLIPRVPHRKPHQSSPVVAVLQQVWLIEEGQPTPLDVRTGLTDGKMTEIVDGSLEPGMALITEQVVPES